jgi:A/G-specific adenine glycosylase
MGKQNWDAEKIARVQGRLLAWYKHNRRDLPWRRNQNPYAIWVSEIMLQQTRVAVVIERYQAFMARFPTLIALAQAPEEQVLALWSGLGYYRRARMLHKAAQFVANNCQGTLPATASELRQLPGIGDYTAAAIASIAYAERIAAVDGNVVRILCRLEGWKDDRHAGNGAPLRRKIDVLANELVCLQQPGDWNQALMDLGATLCLPRNPQCLVCPVSQDCKTQGEHQTAPRPRMLSQIVAYALSIRAGQVADQPNCEVLLEQRPASLSVMPGLWELPTLTQTDVPDKELCMTLRHAIMQINYTVHIRTVREADVEAMTLLGGQRRWVSLDEAATMALTGLARKVLKRDHLMPISPLKTTTLPHR